MLRLGWFATGRGEGSRGFLNLIQGLIEAGSLDATIEFVFSNREHGEAEGSDAFFRLVNGYGLPLITLSSRRYRREHGGGPMSAHRDAFHSEVMGLIAGFSSDVCVLAGYMLIASAEMCRRNSMVNVHPSLPRGPAGTWQQVIWELIGQRARESGVMIHVATEELDSGPVLTYCGYPIRGAEFDRLWQAAEGRSLEELRTEGEEQPLFRKIRQEGLRRERPLLLETLRALSDGRLKISGGRVLNVEGGPASEICLNEEVSLHLR